MKSREQRGAGWVFNIQRYSLHDGPGIRTTVFLKGCPLRCLWCCNPESQRPAPEIVFWPERCIRCDACLAACPENAIEIGSQGERQVLVERCTLCGRCVDVCCSGALDQIGKLMTVAEVLAEVEQDRPFYDESGGGMTLSGGEPTSQPEFSRRLLQGCRGREIHTAIESCGHAPWSVWQALLPYLDLILYDLKETDPERHRRGTGESNEVVLDNLRRLTQSGKRVIVRRPVIPGYNDDPKSMHDLGRIVQSLGGIEQIDLLPYHRMGQSKYSRLGQQYALGDQPSLKAEDVVELRDILVSGRAG
jgi:pyruvate formate lyase activating enzyme